MDVTWETVRKNNIDIILSLEPNKVSIMKDNWILDETSVAAIGFPCPGFPMVRRGRGSGFVWADIGNIVVFSYYQSPNQEIEDFTRFLDELGEEIQRRRGTSVLVAGNFNAKSPKFAGNMRNIEEHI